MSLPKSAYDLSIAQLDRQENYLRSLRAQASAFVALSGLISTLFANLTSNEFQNLMDAGGGIEEFPISLVVVSLTFLGSVGFAMAAMMLWQDCNFDLSPRFMKYRALEEVLEDEIYWEMALLAEDSFDKNENTLLRT